MPEHDDESRSLCIGMDVHLLGACLMGVSYGVLIAVLGRCIQSGFILTVVCVVLFFPIFIASHWVAVLVTTGFAMIRLKMNANKSAERDE
jgi:hypothetical protein